MSVAELLTLVVARGGSKGLPRKNLRRLVDLPLVAWSAEAARAASLPGARWLSTDDAEIAEAGRAAGLEVPFLRPPRLASDTASSLDVVLHALDEHARLHGAEPRWLLLLQPTSPLRPPSALRDAWALAARADCDAIVGVHALHVGPQALFTVDEAGLIASFAAGDTNARRQDVRKLHAPNGAVYLVRSDVLRRERTFFPPRTRALALDAIASLDIDDATDWAIVEAVARAGASWRGQVNP